MNRKKGGKRMGTGSMNPEDYKGEEVWINYNNEIGIWLYSIQLASAELWIDSFETEEEAVSFCDKHELIYN